MLGSNKTFVASQPANVFSKHLFLIFSFLERQKAEKLRKEDQEKKAELRKKEKLAAQEAHTQRRKEMHEKVLKHNEEEARKRELEQEKAASAETTTGELSHGANPTTPSEQTPNSSDQGVDALTDGMAWLDIGADGDAEKAFAVNGSCASDEPKVGGDGSVSREQTNGEPGNPSEDVVSDGTQPPDSESCSAKSNGVLDHKTSAASDAKSDSTLNKAEDVLNDSSDRKLSSTSPNSKPAALSHSAASVRPRSGSSSAALDLASGDPFSRKSRGGGAFSALDLASGFMAAPSRGARHSRSLSDATSTPLSLLQVQERVANSKLMNERGAESRDSKLPDSDDKEMAGSAPSSGKPKSFADALGSSDKPADAVNRETKGQSNGASDSASATRKSGAKSKSHSSVSESKQRVSTKVRFCS